MKTALRMIFIFLLISTAIAGEETVNESIHAIKIRYGLNYSGAEHALLGLLSKYDSFDGQGMIFASIATMYAQKGAHNCDKIIEYAERASKFTLDPSIACQLYIYWGDALALRYQDNTTIAASAARREIILVYLAGIKVTAGRLKITKRQEIPSVSPLGEIHLPKDSSEYKHLLELHQEQEKKRKNAINQNELLEYRTTLINKCSELYSRPPDAIGELEKIAHQNIADDNVVQIIIKKASDLLAQRHTVVVHPTVETESDSKNEGQKEGAEKDGQPPP